MSEFAICHQKWAEKAFPISISLVFLGRTSKNKNKELSTFNPATLDIRSKYASKLKKTVEGGIAGIDLANSKKEDSIKKGDAASGHFIARTIAASQTVSKSGSKWMASTGTGTLCSFLTNRSMKIALIPSPGYMNSNNSTKGQNQFQGRGETKDAMEQMRKQLPNVNFSVLGIYDDDVKEEHCNDEAEDIMKYISMKIETSPISTLVVSDRDDLLRSARDMGMFTCRVRRKNMPRGNVTANYTVEEIQEVQDVVNELNGLSFNTVFSQ